MMDVRSRNMAVVAGGRSRTLRAQYIAVVPSVSLAMLVVGRRYAGAGMSLSKLFTASR